MAILRGYERQQGSRSNTHLVKSGHASPAADWILDKTIAKDAELSTIFPEGVLFKYQYGGVGMEDVTIPKGRFVGVAKSTKSFLDQIYKTPITFPGLALASNVVGMVPYNITKDWLEEDYHGGNKPSVITQEYVVLPYMPGVAPSAQTGKAGVIDEENRISKALKMPWGAVIGQIQEGDYVKATPSGRATKWLATDKDYLRVGQVLEMDLNQESWGWEKWMLWDESARLEDGVIINRSGTTLPSDGGYPFDPEYKEGYLDLLNSYQGWTNSNPTGIPGLHDGSGNYPGFGRNDTDYTDVPVGPIPAEAVENSLVVLNIKDMAGNNVKNLIDKSVVIKVDGVVLGASNLTVNYNDGTITIKARVGDAGKAVTASYKAKHYGTPSYLDFKGVVGSVSILLQM